MLYVNAYPLIFEGTVSLWRIVRAATDDKRTREAELGMALWGERDAFWSAREPQGERATEETFPAAQPQGRVVFARARRSSATPMLSAGTHGTAEAAR